MAALRRNVAFRWRGKRNIWLWCSFAALLGIVRLSKGALLIDVYAFIARPFMFEKGQKELSDHSGLKLAQQIRLDLLEKDNHRLREILKLKNFSEKDRISSSVISRKTNGFWQQLDINKGLINGVKAGDAVLGSGGLIGIVQSATPTTAKVRLLTAPGSKIGVWIERSKTHGVLIGTGNSQPQLNFFSRNSDSKVGDFISTSPASTILPSNIPIGVIQFQDNESLPTPYALIKLVASPSAIDWVQVFSWQ